jgi:hypothetical protein
VYTTTLMTGGSRDQHRLHGGAAAQLVVAGEMRTDVQRSAWDGSACGDGLAASNPQPENHTFTWDYARPGLHPDDTEEFRVRRTSGPDPTHTSDRHVA